MTEANAPTRRIVVGMDFSDAAIKAAKAALEVAVRMHADVHFVNVWQPPQMFHTDVMVWTDGVQGTSLMDHAEKAADERFEELLEQLGPTAVPLSTELVAGHAPDVLTAQSEQPGTILLALGAHGMGWVERALIGSVTNQVLRRAVCPVLTVRAD